MSGTEQPVSLVPQQCCFRVIDRFVLMVIRIDNMGWIVLLALLSFVLTPLSAAAGVITADTVWKGEVAVPEDVLIPAGVTLTILPGTILKIVPADSTKTDPEFLSPLTEITVRGTLKAEGSATLPILFGTVEGDQPEGWAGIIVDGGSVILRSCTVQDAETGVHAVKGSLLIKNSVVQKNRYGIVVQGPEGNVSIEDSRVSDNEYGMVLINGAKIGKKNNAVAGNRKKDAYSAPTKDTAPAAKAYRAETGNTSRMYGDAVLPGDTVWQGMVEVNGIIRVPAEGRLLIMPGTVIAFTKKDTNHDGIGENGLLIQGTLIAKGTREHPILFRSAGRHRRMGDWDAVNIMNSDRAQNLIEYCQIEDAYRGLHFHFSNVAIHNSIVRNNYRGVQFQESTVEMSGNHVYGNKSGVQARDSGILFADNSLYHNYSGANFFRASLTAAGNTITGNLREGLRIREGIPRVERNLMDGNRFGIMVSDTVYGVVRGNVVSHNSETGVLLKNADNVEVDGNYIQGNGLNGMNVQNARAVIKGNVISENGERGIGIMSFDGTITGNNFVKNGLYALGLDGAGDIAAPGNWWGGDGAGRVIYDKEDDPAKGRVGHSPASGDPLVFRWPLDDVAVDITWHGTIQLAGRTAAAHGATLTVAPGARVVFAKGAGLAINGRLIAAGQEGRRIAFTSLEGRGAGDWDEIFLDHANGSVFSRCDIEYATWGIHSHFTQLRVTDCSFSNNYGGVRFQSGPVDIRRSRFQGNAIGLRAFRGSAVIAENIITGNEIGIFVRERGSGLNVERNDIFSNSRYNIRLGDFNDEDVRAPDNYWGAGEPADMIYDGTKEPGIGTVRYDPYRREPCAGEGVKR